MWILLLKKRRRSWKKQVDSVVEEKKKELEKPEDSEIEQKKNHWKGQDNQVKADSTGTESTKTVSLKEKKMEASREVLRRWWKFGLTG